MHARTVTLASTPFNQAAFLRMWLMCSARSDTTKTQGSDW